MATARRPHAAAHIKIAAGAPTRPPVGGFPKRGSPATASAASSSARRAGRCIATAAPMSGSGPASRLHRACDGCTQGLRWPLSNHVGPLLLKNCATPARQLQAGETHTPQGGPQLCVSSLQLSRMRAACCALQPSMPNLPPKVEGCVPSSPASSSPLAHQCSADQAVVLSGGGAGRSRCQRDAYSSCTGLTGRRAVSELSNPNGSSTGEWGW